MKLKVYTVELVVVNTEYRDSVITNK